MADFNHNIDSIRIEPDNKTREVGRKDVNYIYGYSYNPFGLPEAATPIDYAVIKMGSEDVTWLPNEPNIDVIAPKAQAGLRYDDGKTPYHLIPPELLEGVGQVLGFGAKKYTRKFQNEWEGLWELAGAKRLSLFTASDCVAHVTKENSGKLILSLQTVNVKTGTNGAEKTLIESNSWLEIEARIHEVVKETRERNFSNNLNTSGRVKPNTKNTWKEAALSAVQPNSYTLITTIKPGNFEEYFVVNTTTVSDSLETTLKELKPRLGISKNATLLEVPGTRNWELGMDWSRVFASLMRHAWKFWRGEKVDEETGLPHTWHMATNVAFLMAYEERGVGKDDRPV